MTGRLLLHNVTFWDIMEDRVCIYGGRVKWQRKKEKLNVAYIILILTYRGEGIVEKILLYLIRTKQLECCPYLNLFKSITIS